MRDIDLSVFYEENGRVAAVFWEWRHKVILLVASTLAAVVAVAAWLYERRLGGVICVPFFLGSIVVFVCSRFEQRIAVVLVHCYYRGWLLERHAAESAESDLEKMGVYRSFAYRAGKSMDTDKPLKGSFMRTLRWSYRVLAGLLAAAAIATVVIASVEPSWLRPKAGTAKKMAMVGARPATAAFGEPPKDV
jgi:hypothetical protein